MTKMTHRERVIRTFKFQQVDRIACDLMESMVWQDLAEYFSSRYGLADKEQILQHLDVDFRWVSVNPTGMHHGEGLPEGYSDSYSDSLYKRPLAEALTVADVESNYKPDPAKWEIPDFNTAREKWPDYALVFSPGWMPLFAGACDTFGMENAMVKMLTEPCLIEAYLNIHNEFYMDIMKRGLEKGKGLCDICWLGDDYANNSNMLINPDLWRRYIKPHLAKQVNLAKTYGMFVLLHSCGAIRSIIPDLIDIGVDALLVFQTKARGMDAKSIARDFGGKIVFYGGIDAQELLVFGSIEDVRNEVEMNIWEFSKCGGYIVANSHHGLPDIRPENIEMMCRVAQRHNLISSMEEC